MNASYRSYLAELVGTFVLVLLTAGAVCASGIPSLAGHEGYGRIGIALAAGLAWCVCLAFTLRHSDGYLNPAITVTLWVFQRIDNKRAMGFIVAQLMGAAFAGLALRGLFFANDQLLVQTRMGSPHLNQTGLGIESVDRTSVIQGIGIEAVLAFILVFVIFALIYDPRFRQKAGEKGFRLAYFWLGLVVMAEVLVAYDLTGACLNPARWFGTVVWESTVRGLSERNPWADHGPYWIGPTVGALLAGMLYTYLLMPDETPKGPPAGGLP
jgi:glycerol uptake facilitator-like aquaporin